MFKKGTKLYSIFSNKCPRCHEGDFFVEKNLLKFKKIVKLHTNCTHCDLKFMMEPSFFVGAMYVNYGLTIAVSVAAFLIAKVFIGLSINQSFVAIIGALILFIPIGLRLSRLIWINMFVTYENIGIDK